ncbi:MAG: Zn-ribbon domain-containing OB-fold protein [Chloroflexi bacterium]|nr:Zn-ribbon domain-containing OB-fold protein [Chloroflexota bacterium]
MAKRPQPRFPEPHTEHFWEGAQQGELRYQRCNEDCGDPVVFYPRHHCPDCGSDDLDWHVSKGEGTVYTFSVVRQNRMPGFIDLGAYSVAYIDLDEGFRMMSSVVGVDDPTTEIQIGQRVRVEFEEQEEGDYPIPVFRPIEED